MAKFNLEDYEPVEERIKRFYSDHPDGAISTQLVSSVECLETVVMMAAIFIGDRQVSTGYAFEVEGEGFVNKTSHLENCETSAIGRALANFNYSGNKRPSREEMSKVEKGEKPATEKPIKKTPANDKDLAAKFFDDFIGDEKIAGQITDYFFKMKDDETRWKLCNANKWNKAEIDKAISAILLEKVVS